MGNIPIPAKATPTVNAQRKYLNERLDDRGRYSPPRELKRPTPAAVLRAKGIVRAHEEREKAVETERVLKYRADRNTVRASVMFDEPDVALEKLKAFEARWPE